MKNSRIILSCFFFLALICHLEAKDYTGAPQISESGSAKYSEISAVVNAWKTGITDALASRSSIMDQVENCVNYAAKDLITDDEYNTLATALYWWLNQVADEGRDNNNAKQGWNILDIDIPSDYLDKQQCVWRLAKPEVGYKRAAGLNISSNGRLVLFVSDYEYASDEYRTDTPLTNCTMVFGSCTDAIMQTSGGGKVIFFGKSGHEIIVKGNKTWDKSTSRDVTLARNSESATDNGQLAYIKGGSILTAYATFKNSFPKFNYSKYEGQGESKYVIGGAIGLVGALGKCSFYHTAVNDNALPSGFGAGVGIYGVSSISDGGIYFNRCEFNGNIIIGKEKGTGAHGGAIGGYFDGGKSSEKLYFKNTTFTYNCQYTINEAHGGAIFYRDTGRACEIENCTFTGNYAHGATAGGGAISSEGILTIRNTEFTDNWAQNSFGGAIYTRPVLDAAQSVKTINLTVSGCTFRNNKCTWENNSSGAGTSDEIKSADIERGSGGAILIDIFRGVGDSDGAKYNCGLSLDNNCIFDGNHADRNGGAVAIVMMNIMKSWISSHKSQVTSSLSLNSATISNNTAGAEKTWTPSGSIYNKGGAIYLSYTSLNITSNAVSVYGNEALCTDGKGGGAAIYNGNLIIDGGYLGTSDQGNSALTGGGAYINGGSLTVNGGTISKNKSTSDNAGGVMVDGGDVTITNGTVSGNESYLDGGALSVSGGKVTIEGGTITKNFSSRNGGAIISSGGNLIINDGSIKENESSFSGGAFYVQNGDITINNGSISQNTANGNGGAAYFIGGNVTLTGGTVTENHAKIKDGIGGYGGGLYVSNSDNTKKLVIKNGSVSKNTAETSGGGISVENGVVEITYGEINENKAAVNGGGIFASGGTMYFNRDNANYGSILSNEASNGGGVYLTNGARMEIQEALISKNHAIASTSINTAYHGDTSLSGKTIQGMGAGVYLAKGTESQNTVLQFKRLDTVVSLGIYGNIADNGGDEIVSEGQNTEMYIPSVTDMQLSVFGGKSQGWFEDYINGDTAYNDASKTDVIRADEGVPARFRESILAGNKTFAYSANLATAETRYACLTLGPALTTLKISKTGLKTGESAIFTVSRDGYRSRSAILTGIGDGTEVSTTLHQMEVGDWTVTESAWSWSYSADKSVKEVRLFGGDFATEDKNKVSFTNTQKTDIPKHAESVKMNNLSNQGAMSIGMGSDEL